MEFDIGYEMKDKELRCVSLDTFDKIMFEQRSHLIQYKIICEVAEGFECLWIDELSIICDQLKYEGI